MKKVFLFFAFIALSVTMTAQNYFFTANHKVTVCEEEPTAIATDIYNFAISLDALTVEYNDPKNEFAETILEFEWSLNPVKKLKVWTNEALYELIFSRAVVTVIRFPFLGDVLSEQYTRRIKPVMSSN